MNRIKKLDGELTYKWFIKKYELIDDIILGISKGNGNILFLDTE